MTKSEKYSHYNSRGSSSDRREQKPPYTLKFLKIIDDFQLQDIKEFRIIRSDKFSKFTEFKFKIFNEEVKLCHWSLSQIL